MGRSFLLLTLSVFVFAGCDDGSGLRSVATVTPTGDIAINVDRETQLDLSRRLADRLNPDVELGAVTGEPKVQKIGDEYRLVTRFTQAGKAGSCLTTAVRLDKAEDGSLGLLSNFANKAAPEGDTCGGVNCSGCELLQDEQGRNYCDCFRPGGGTGASYCNHTGG